MTQPQKNRLRIKLATFALYLHNDTGVANDNHEGEILKFEELIDEFIKEAAEDICVIIDEIESKSETNTLEEWKQYKHIRNSIRDKYVLKENE